MTDGLKTLGTAKAEFSGLETFESPAGVALVSLVTDECCAVCPVTGQPDWYSVTAEYVPCGLCIESKTFKLYVQSFRNNGMFCEQFADRIAIDCAKALRASVTVTVTQKPRGGVTIICKATRSPE
jgi:7-cyano-7-deazaguanine reductase